MVGWVAFNLYWSAAAKNFSPAKNSESRRSRLMHEILLNLALLLLFIRVPGLNARFLPDAPVLAWTGLGIQAL